MVINISRREACASGKCGRAVASGEKKESKASRNFGLIEKNALLFRMEDLLKVHASLRRKAKVGLLILPVFKRGNEENALAAKGAGYRKVHLFGSGYILQRAVI